MSNILISGQKLKVERDKHPTISQEKLSRMCGMSLIRISTIECNELTSIRSSTLRKLCSALEIDTRALIPDEYIDQYDSFLNSGNVLRDFRN